MKKHRRYRNGKIQNRVIRRILKQIALWDTCPTDYQLNFKKLFIELGLIAATVFAAINAFILFTIYFS